MCVEDTEDDSENFPFLLNISSRKTLVEKLISILNLSPVEQSVKIIMDKMIIIDVSDIKSEVTYSLSYKKKPGCLKLYLNSYT